MAKKENVELSVEEKLKTLFMLQTSLSAIDEKKALRGELPLEVQDLEDEIEGLKIRIEKIQTEIDEFQKAVSDRKADILDAQASVARYKMQLDDVKNNREYDTLSKEIEFQSLEIELCNKKIREAQQKIKDKTLEKEQSERNLEDHENELEVKPMHDTRISASCCSQGITNLPFSLLTPPVMKVESAVERSCTLANTTGRPFWSMSWPESRRCVLSMHSTVIRLSPTLMAMG